MPSPALTTLALTAEATRRTEPEQAWRMMMVCTFMASMLRTVSSRVSPLASEEVEAAKLTTSAERRLAASSKDVRVRVEFSKKRFTTVFPRSAGTFLMGRCTTSLKERAVSRISKISSAESSSRPNRSLRCKPMIMPP